MELSTGQQRLLFVVVVLLLAGLGIYLLGPASHHKAAAAPTATPTPTPSSSPPATAASSPPAAQSATPATESAPAATGTANIYQWLPFTEQDLAQAAQVTTAFAAYYDTYSYTETAAAYGEKMASVVTTEFDAQLVNGYAAPGVAAQRSAQKQVATSSGAIVQIRSFGAQSIMFVVDITQRLTTTKATTTTTSQYWVTVVSQAVGWQVNDIEPAGAGNP